MTHPVMACGFLNGQTPVKFSTPIAQSPAVWPRTTLSGRGRTDLWLRSWPSVPQSGGLQWRMPWAVEKNARIVLKGRLVLTACEEGFRWPRNRCEFTVRRR